MDSLIVFPTTPEAFIAYQENGINRKLNKSERKLCASVVELINASYQDGLDGEENTLTMRLVRERYAERGKNIERFIRIWESVCWWCDKAYQFGREVSQ